MKQVIPRKSTWVGLRRCTPCLGAVLLIGGACTQGRVARPPERATDAAVRGAAAVRDLAPWLASWRAEHELPALAAAVLVDGRPAALGAVGRRKADADVAVTVEDPFHLGSCTKSMTATLCALLVEDGKLAWDTTIAAALPDLSATIRPEYRAVTLEQLLCHRSGLPEDRAPGAVLWRLRMLAGDMRAQRRRAAAIILDQPPAAAPGEQFLYSNFGYIVAAAMAEHAVGASWEDLTRERLFVPLGMHTAGFGPPDSAGRLAQPWGHRVVMGRPVPVEPGPLADNPAVLGPAGTVHCSLGDWMKYAAVHCTGRVAGDDSTAGRVLLKPEALARLHMDPFGGGYAFGWGVRREGDEESSEAGPSLILQHAGSNSMWFAFLRVRPRTGFAVLVATNRGDEGAAKACGVVAEALEREFLGSAAESRPSKAP